MAEPTKTGVARMRTRDQAIAQLKQDDPDTALTRNSLDYLIASGKLPHVLIGNKVLINYDTLVELLVNGIADAPQEPQGGGIRPVKI